MKSENKLTALEILSAISASLCGITPVLALAEGTGGLATTCSRLGPARPYLISSTILILGLA